MKLYSCNGCGKQLTDSQVHDDVKAGEAVAVCKTCYEPDWSGTCGNCSATPIVPITGMCGPCTWGDASTIGGNW